MAITPRRAGDGRVDDFRLEPGDVRKRIFHHPLLDGGLGEWIEVLERAPAANAEMRTRRRHPPGAGVHDAPGCGLIIIRPRTQHFVFDPLTDERAVNEYGFTANAGDAPPFVVERDDGGDRHDLEGLEKRAILAQAFASLRENISALARTISPSASRKRD
ncbi:hypothetical protein FACS1894116_02100 [Betaproteobacteria bacterium]|nr:hypothetical protein FACS1894116_02100 [Betaproteobacteria bacterium]GHT99549.1 hypothetical protein FACS1894154_06850 [Betaproteobacteria bacterium]GHU11654.1 hypothetical protein AGMMS50225_17650 [Betaproteobacteria bacterium]